MSLMAEARERQGSRAEDVDAIEGVQAEVNDVLRDRIAQQGRLAAKSLARRAEAAQPAAQAQPGPTAGR